MEGALGLGGGGRGWEGAGEGGWAGARLPTQTRTEARCTSHSEVTPGLGQSAELDRLPQPGDMVPGEWGFLPAGSCSF